nr:hypothetical protein [uncultured Rhodopila sp.]
MKKENLMTLLADLSDGSEIRIPAPVLVRTFDLENLTDLHWHDRLLNGLARLIPAVVTAALMLIMIGSTIPGARWLASGAIRIKPATRA